MLTAMLADERGLALSSTSQDAVRLYGQAIHAFLDYRSTASAKLKAALTADPDFCMAHCLRGYFFQQFGTFTVIDKARAALAEAQRCAPTANMRERAHVEALRAWIDGDVVEACRIWESLLFEYPLDLLALRLHHFTSFWMGRSRALRAVPASVLPSWSASTPGYGNVLGMLAFGHEETGDYEHAERYGRMAVETSPDDLWALHAVAHVLEMTGRNDEGQTWLARPHDHWDDRNPFKRHLWWHLALFMIEAGRLDETLALYDRSVLGQGSDFYLDIQNAASLLARLEFCGMDVGDRWRGLADYAEAHIDDHALVFTDLHCLMSLAHEGRFDAARRLIGSMASHAQDNPLFAGGVIRDLGVPLCEGILAFEEARYPEAIERLMRLRHDNAPLGASHAQRDIFDQYLIEAALRSGATETARGLLQERRALRPNSRETELKLSRLYA